MERYQDYYEDYARKGHADDTFTDAGENTIHVFNVTDDDREKTNVPEVVTQVIVFDLDGPMYSNVFFSDLETHLYLEAAAIDYDDEYLPEDD